MLSHANILSNVQGVLQTLSIGKGDGLFGVLPFFHSFGYTVTLWGPLLAGAKAIYHANPLDAKVIGEMSEEHRATIFVATPTFYQAYMRRCSPEQFAHLRVALSGAEKLRRPLANAWEEKYGLPLMEGYGCTELSPVVSFNVPDVELMGERQLGNKPGTIGRALPGIATRIVDPDTGVRYGPGEEGLLLVKGPNVMQGYYNDPEKTAEVIQDGWYSTGDIAIMDAGGFLAITDRLSRFSKIGGEMVPHGRVEECLEAIVSAHALDPESPAEVAVTALPDEKKGEQLVVLHTSLPISVEALLEELARGDLPKLFQPRAQNFIEVEAIPKLGTGKTNLKGLKQIASSARAPE
jgi:acyl-[acyl-carrier-protein]-phospholipid O-acyltransferase/long-chain-fatty-acid--[acyl-carrier-protein] ligase